MKALLRTGTDAALSIRTFVAAVIIAGSGFFYTQSAVINIPSPNAWDAIFPTLTETTTVSQVVLLWWLTWVIPECATLRRPEVLIRYGSAWAASVRLLGLLAARLVGGGAVFAVAGTVMTAPLGYSLSWSPSAAAAGVVSPSAFSAVALAGRFGSPIRAITLCCLFSACALLTVAALAIVLSSRGQIGVARWGLVSFYCWALACSFAVFPAPAQLDASVALALPWALAHPGGVATTIITDVAIIAVCVVIARSRGGLRSTLRGAAGSQMVLATVLAAITVAAVWRSVMQTAGTNATFTDVYFAGAHGDIVQFVMVMVVPLTIASAEAADLSDRGAARQEYEMMRSGSIVRWARRELVRRLGRIAAVLAVYAAAVLITGAALTDEKQRAAAVAGAALSILGVAASTILLTCFAFVLFYVHRLGWWPAVVGLVFVLSYPVLLQLGEANIFAPFSTDPAANDDPRWIATATSTGCVAAGIGALFAIATRHVGRRQLPTAQANERQAA